MHRSCQGHAMCRRGTTVALAGEGIRLKQQGISGVVLARQSCLRAKKRARRPVNSRGKNNNAYLPVLALALLMQRSFASPDRLSQRSRAALYSACWVSWLALLRASATRSRLSLLASADSLLTLASPLARVSVALASFTHTSLALPDMSSHFSFATAYSASALATRACSCAFGVPLSRASSSAFATFCAPLAS